jgi:uncharacterized protein
VAGLVPRTSALPSLTYTFPVLSEIWRYPVKSCGGEILSEAEVQEGGLTGDRAWAVVDSQTGLVASAKRPRRWGPLLTTSASLTGSDLTVNLTSGQTGSSSDLQALDAMISSLVGRSVTVRSAVTIEEPALERTDPDVDHLLEHGDLELGDIAAGPLSAASPRGTVFDFAPIHVISTATLDALEEADTSAGDARRFRPNLVVDIDGPAFQENEWRGRQLNVGSDVVLDVILESPRCVVPSLAQDGLAQSSSTLRTVALLNRIEIEGHGVFPCVGAYAKVGQSGTITTGARATVST